MFFVYYFHCNPTYGKYNKYKYNNKKTHVFVNVTLRANESTFYLKNQDPLLTHVKFLKNQCLLVLCFKWKK